jgi:hypothetical protein
MKDSLIERSSAAAIRAIQHYISDEYDQFLTEAAHSFELLCKARLAAIHPSLIVDKDFDSLLHVCAAGKHAKRPIWNIKTITATEALARNIQMNPLLNDFRARMTLLAEYLGEIVETEEKEIFNAFLSSTVLIIDDMGITRKKYFEEYEGLVATHLDKSLAETQREVAGKMALASTTFAERFAILHPEAMELVAKSIEGTYPVEKYELILFECPVCKYRGLLSGTHEVEWEADHGMEGNMEGAYPIVTLNASGFTCGFCELELNGAAELVAAGIPSRVGIEDVDVEDFYEDYSNL